MAQHITVVDHNPAWAAQYAAEAEKLRAVLGENCTAIHHIGSTAVPGLKAKPILDIMPVVRDLRRSTAQRRISGSSATNTSGNSAFPGGATCARAGTSARIRSTSFRRTTPKISSGTSPCAITCGRTMRPSGSTVH